MCRNIRTLFNFEPPATDDEVRASAEQFVRKLSGFTKPSKANEAAFDLAVKDVTNAAHRAFGLAANGEPAAQPRRSRDESAGPGCGKVRPAPSSTLCGQERA